MATETRLLRFQSAEQPAHFTMFEKWRARVSPPKSWITLCSHPHLLETPPFGMPVQENQIAARGHVPVQVRRAMRDRRSSHNCPVTIPSAIGFVRPVRECGVSDQDTLAGWRLEQLAADSVGQWIERLGNICGTNPAGGFESEGVANHAKARGRVLLRGEIPMLVIILLRQRRTVKEFPPGSICQQRLGCCGGKIPGPKRSRAVREPIERFGLGIHQRGHRHLS